jgi:hypothetical protein
MHRGRRCARPVRRDDGECREYFDGRAAQPGPGPPAPSAVTRAMARRCEAHPRCRSTRKDGNDGGRWSSTSTADPPRPISIPSVDYNFVIIDPSSGGSRNQFRRLLPRKEMAPAGHMLCLAESVGRYGWDSHSAAIDTPTTGEQPPTCPTSLTCPDILERVSAVVFPLPGSRRRCELPTEEGRPAKIRSSGTLSAACATGSSRSDATARWR